MKQNRRSVQPYVVDGVKVESLERISLTFSKEQRNDGGDKHFPETWLQELIKKQPDILPINQIEPLFSPAISIGRETVTKVGSIDNLLVTSEGYITIVETKLWRNTEARREVIGQIVDYAQELSKWSYDDINAAVKVYSQKHGGEQQSLYELVKTKSPTPADEIDFVDNVSANLSSGRFLLLIVGDGIREEVESLSAFLNEKTGLHFTLGLVELQAYRLPESNKIFVLPQVVAQTREIVRHVIRIDDGMAIKEVVAENEKSQKLKSSKSPITVDVFFKQLQEKTGHEPAGAVKRLLNHLEDKGCEISWARITGSARLRSNLDPAITYNLVSVDSNGFLYVAFLQSAFRKLNLPSELYETFVKESGQLFNKSVNEKHPDTWQGLAKVELLPDRLDKFLVLIDLFIDKVQEAEDKTTWV